MNVPIVSTPPGKKVRASLAALILCLVAPNASLAATATLFDANFDNGTPGAATSASSLGTPAVGTWSFVGAAQGGITTDASDKAALFAKNTTTAITWVTPPTAVNTVAFTASYPNTKTIDANGNTLDVIANLASPGSFTGAGNSTTISFNWGQCGTANSALCKYAFVRGLDASGNEVFELLFSQLNPANTSQIYARGASDSSTTRTSASAGTPQGTLLINGFGADTTFSLPGTATTKPTGLIGVTITLTNNQVTYAFSKGTASGNALTYAVNSSATTISKLEFSTIAATDASGAIGYWLNNVLVNTTTYTVAYNGNGNTGGTAPTDGSSPYVAGASVTVLGNTGSLTKTGNAFANWNTAADGSGTTYNGGNTFNIASNTTLYAQWSATVTYNGNGNDGGTVPVDGSSPYLSGASVTVLGNTGSLTKSGNSFNGWNTVANGSGTARSVGSTFNIATNTTLYAQWLGSGTITAPATFTNAVATIYGTASNPQSVPVSGSGLTADILATAPTGLEISTNGTTYGATATFAQSGGNVTGTLFVRLAATAPVSGSYNSKNIILASTGAASVNVATTASGNTVTPKALSVASATAQNKPFDGTTAATISGTLSGIENGDAVTFNGVGTFASSAVGTGISVTSACTLDGGAVTNNYTLTQPIGLTASILSAAVWTNPAGGAWSTASNWQLNAIGNGSGTIVDFSTLDITVDATVNLDSARTVGNLVFGDTDNSSAAGWILSDNATPANILTLAGTTPTVTVNPLGTDKTVTVNAVIAGSAGLVKSGAGTLTLAGTNTYTGLTTISNGTVQLSGGDNRIKSGNSVFVDVAGTLDLNGQSQTLSGVTGTGNVTNSGSGILTINNASTSTNGCTIKGAGSVVKTSGGTLVLTGASTYTGWTTNNGAAPIEIQHGSALGSTAGGTYIAAGGALWLRGGIAVGDEPLILNGGSPSATGTLRSVNGNNTYGGLITLAAGSIFGCSTNTLTITNTGTITGSGSILTNFGNGNVTINSIIGTGTGGVIRLNGTGTLTLNGANTYTGPTTVAANAGTLVVNGSTASGSTVTINNGGILRGSGTINGPIVLSSGTTLAPGNDSIGTLTCTNAVALAATNNFRLNKAGVTLTSDQVASATSITAGGQLNVSTNTGTDILTGGESFTLFNTTPTGTFTSTNLPVLAAGLNWWTANNFRTITVNRAPTASAIVAGTSQGEALSITIIGGKIAPSDADNDTLTISAVQSPSANGAAVSTDGTSVTINYSGVGSFSGEDTFTYTVNDGKGGTKTATVTVQVTAASTGANVLPGSLSVSEGIATMQALGIPGAYYHLQYTTSLSPVNWQDVTDGNVQASPANGSLTLTDSGASGPSRYYRTRYVSGP